MKKVHDIEVIEAKLELYSIIPPNGLIILYGDGIKRDNISQITVDLDFEPFKSLSYTNISIKDNFNVSELKYLIQEEDSIQFIRNQLYHENLVLESLYRSNIECLIRGAASIVDSIKNFSVQKVVVCQDLDLFKVTYKNPVRNNLKTLYLPFHQIEKTTESLKVSKFLPISQI